jgi:hypothetical protein
MSSSPEFNFDQCHPPSDHFSPGYNVCRSILCPPLHLVDWSMLQSPMHYGHVDGAASGLCTSVVGNTVGLSDVSLSSLCKMRLNDSLFAQFSVIQDIMYLGENLGYPPTPSYLYTPPIEPTVNPFPTVNNNYILASHTASPCSYSSCSSSAPSTPSPYAASVDLPHRDCYSRISTPVEYHRPTSSASSYSLPQDPRHTPSTLSRHPLTDHHGELQSVSTITSMATHASALTSTAVYPSYCSFSGSDSVSSHGSPYNSPYMAPSVDIGTYDYPSPPAAEMPSPSPSYTSNISHRTPRQRSSLSKHARRNVVTDAKSFPPSMGSGSKGTSVAQALGGRPMRLIEEPKRDYTKVACKPCRNGKKKCGGDSKSACP